MVEDNNEKEDGNERNQFKLYLLIVFLIGLSLGINLVAIPLFLIDLKISDLEFGIIIGSSSIGSIFVKLPLGILSDRISKKKLLSIGCLLLSASTILFPYYTSHLLLLRIIQGFSMSMIFIPLAVLFIETFKEAKTGWYNSSITLGFSTLGPVFGGFLPQIVGYRSTFLFSGVLLLILIQVLQKIEEPVNKNIKDIRKERKCTTKKNVPSLINASLFGSANSAAFMVFTSFMPIFMVKILNSNLAGIIIFLEGITFVIFAVPIVNFANKFGRLKMLLLGSVFMVVSFFFLYLTVSIENMMLVSIFIGISVAIVRSTSFSIAAESMSEKGKAIGIYHTANDVGGIVGPSLAGMLSMSFGIRYAFLSVIPIMFICWLMFTILNIKSLNIRNRITKQKIE